MTAIAEAIPRLQVQFNDWLRGSRSGDRVVYFIGEYARGAQCREARIAADAGRVFLMQRRTLQQGRRGQFEYIAQRV